ncbi:hypothetical protein ACWD3D_35395, partial [Streptomyces sp. NPDC002690]
MTACVAEGLTQGGVGAAREPEPAPEEPEDPGAPGKSQWREELETSGRETRGPEKPAEAGRTATPNVAPSGGNVLPVPVARTAAPGGFGEPGPDGSPADGSPAHEGVAPMAIRVVVTGRTVVPTGAPTGRGTDATTLVPLVGAVVGSPVAAAFHTSTGASAPATPAVPLSGAAATARPGTGSPTPATR